MAATHELPYTDRWARVRESIASRRCSRPGMASAGSNGVLQGQLSRISFLRRFLLRSRAENLLRSVKSSLTRANHIVARAALAPSAGSYASGGPLTNRKPSLAPWGVAPRWEPRRAAKGVLVEEMGDYSTACEGRRRRKGPSAAIKALESRQDAGLPGRRRRAPGVYSVTSQVTCVRIRPWSDSSM